MKLSKLLQWLKIKLLPSSILKKGRLAIERFNKQRFNTLNFGVVFRNSKWANYAKKNINQTKSSFLNKVAKLVILIILLLLLMSLVMGVDFTKTVVNIGYWQLRDLTDYFWLCAAAGYNKALTILKPLMLDLFAWLYFPPEIYEVYKRERKAGMKAAKKAKKSEKYKKKPKPSSASEKTNREFGINLSLFESLKDLNFSNKPLNLFNSSFELVKNQLLISKLFQRVNDQSALTSLKSMIRRDLWIDRSQPITSENRAFASLRMLTNAANFNLNTNKIYVKPLKSSYQSSIFQNFKLHNNLFNITDLTSNSNIRKLVLLKEFLPIPSILKDLTSVTRSKRWLYQYNLLQSKSIAGANNITNVKRLTSTGSYTFDILSKNLWAANTLNKVTNRHAQFAPLFKNVYGDYFMKIDKSADFHKNYFITTPNSGLELTKYYESGYFWFLKRLYLLNTNSALSVKVTPLANILIDVLNGNMYPELVTIDTRLSKVLIPFKTTNHPSLLSDAKVNDLFYGNDSDTFFNQSVLLDLYSMSSDKIAPNSLVVYYSLNKYSTLIGESSDLFKVRFFNSSKNRFELAKIFKQQSRMSPAYIDLINKKYTKDLYSFIILNTKK